MSWHQALSMQLCGFVWWSKVSSQMAPPGPLRCIKWAFKGVKLTLRHLYASLTALVRYYANVKVTSVSDTCLVAVSKRVLRLASGCLNATLQYHGVPLHAHMLSFTVESSATKQRVKAAERRPKPIKTRFTLQEEH